MKKKWLLVDLMRYAVATIFCCMLSYSVMAQSADTNTDAVTQRNKQVIEKINRNTIGFSSTVQKKDKNASAFLCQFFADDDAEFINGDVELSYEISGERDVMAAKCRPTLIVTVKNKTNHILYIDLANTFIVRGDDSQPYYVPSEVQVTNGAVKSTTTNQGAITDALGIHGRLGKYAHGKDVTKEKVNVTTATVVAQRVVAIPPKSSKKLDEIRIFDSKTKSGPILHSGSSDADYLALKIAQGNAMEWDAENSPVRWGAFVTYSSDEAITTEVHSLGGMMYMHKVWGLPLPLMSVTGYNKWREKNFTGVEDGLIYFPMNNYVLHNGQLSTFDGTVVE